MYKVILGHKLVDSRDFEEEIEVTGDDYKRKDQKVLLLIKSDEQEKADQKRTQDLEDDNKLSHEKLGLESR